MLGIQSDPSLQYIGGFSQIQIKINNVDQILVDRLVGNGERVKSYWPLGEFVSFGPCSKQNDLVRL